MGWPANRYGEQVQRIAWPGAPVVVTNGVRDDRLGLIFLLAQCKGLNVLSALRQGW